MDEKETASEGLQVFPIEMMVRGIRVGSYNNHLSELRAAIEWANEERKGKVEALVREVFGPDARVVVERLGLRSGVSNPFVEAAKAAQGEVEQADSSTEYWENTGRLPGPYRVDPVNGNSMRAASPPDAAGFLTITDVFGGHASTILKSIWESWMPAEDDEEVESSDPLAHLDEVEAKMSNEPTGGDETVQTNVTVPIERRGAVISGLHSSDMGN